MSATVIPIRRKGKHYAHDPVFFTKDQIVVGTTLIHVGRLDPSAWIVERIVHITQRGGRRQVNVVETFSDLIYLRRANGAPPLKKLNFGYMCYSAVWRVG
jgi:hypothetical protein